MKININNCPNLFNLLTLPEVIDPNTTVYCEDSDTSINLCDFIHNVYNELQSQGLI